MLKGCQASFLLGTDVVAGLKSISNPLTSETLDTTTFDSSCVKEFIAGLRSGTITISGLYDPDDTAGQVAMYTAMLAGTTLTTTQKPKILWDATNGIEADGMITTITTDGQVEGLITFNATIQLTGAITIV